MGGGPLAAADPPGALPGAGSPQLGQNRASSARPVPQFVQNAIAFILLLLELALDRKQNHTYD